MKHLHIFLLLLSGICIRNISVAQVGLHFNGTNSVTSSYIPLTNNQSRTVDAWIKTTSTITTQMVICDWGNTTPNGSRFTLNVINNRLRIEVGGVGMTGNTLVNTGQWVHATAVYESSITSGPNVFLYVNGVLDASGNFTGYPVLTTTNTIGFRLGARSDGINLFTGSMDEVKVYNYARTQAEVQADTLEYCGPQPGLVLYYKLNEGIPNAVNTGSTTVTDYSGNNGNGTLSTNFALTGTVSNWVPGRVRANAPLISASPGTLICSGNTMTLSAPGASNYTWSTGNTTSTIITVSPTVSGTYSISVTNTQNCVAYSTISITVSNGLPNLTVTAQQNPICLGASTSFSASGANSYTWTGGIINGQTFTPTVTTSYSVIASNACGSVTSVQTITVNPLQVTVTPTQSVVCQGSTATLIASSSVSSYTWLPGPLTGSIAVVSPTSATIYTVSASNGSCSGTQTVQLGSLPSPSVSIQTATSVPFTTFLCQGQAYTATAIASASNVTYNWLPAGGNASTAILSPSASAVYTVICTGGNGCSGMATAIIVLQQAPVFSIFSNRPLVCPGQSATLTTNATGTYTWSNGLNTSSIIVSPSAPTSNYSLTATSNNNTCTSTQTISVGVLTPTVNYTSTLNICAGSSGTLSAVGPSTYSWNGVPGNPVAITPSASGTYTLSITTISQALVCNASFVSTVTILPVPSVSAIASHTQICRNITQSTLTVNGASTYTWLNTGSTSTQIVVSPITNTNYTVVGMSASGCTDSALVLIRVSPCPGLAEIGSDNVINVYPNPARDKILIELPAAARALIMASDGKKVRDLLLTEGLQQIDIHNLKTGVYTVVVQFDEAVIQRRVVIE